MSGYWPFLDQCASLQSVFGNQLILCIQTYSIQIYLICSYRPPSQESWGPVSQPDSRACQPRQGPASWGKGQPLKASTSQPASGARGPARTKGWEPDGPKGQPGPRASHPARPEGLGSDPWLRKAPYGGYIGGAVKVRWVLKWIFMILRLIFKLKYHDKNGFWKWPFLDLGRTPDRGKHLMEGT